MYENVLFFERKFRSLHTFFLTNSTFSASMYSNGKIIRQLNIPSPFKDLEKTQIFANELNTRMWIFPPANPFWWRRIT